MPFETLLESVGLILITELGDKTMLTAMCLSAQYRRPWIVLAATMLALSLSTSISVIVGVVLAMTLPIDFIVYVSGLLFIGLGVYSIVRSGSEEVEVCDNPGTFMSMVSLILFSELGDKSQLAILALSVQSLFPIMVFVGAIIGFLVVNLLGVYAGDWIACRISMKTVKKVAGLVFIAFGILVIFGII